MIVPPDLRWVAELGWRVYPRAARHRAAAFEGAAKQATHDLDTLSRWSRAYPGCGWYCVTGPSGIFALDVDAPPKADGVTALRELTARHGPLPDRPMVRTGGGGWALVFAHDGAPLIGRTGTPAKGIDPRRGAQTITLPPTLHHATGSLYRWVTPPWEVQPPPASEWLLTLLREPPSPRSAEVVPIPSGTARRDRYLAAALRRAVEAVASAGPGRRNDTLNRETHNLGRFLATGELTPGELASAMATAARHAGLPERETVATITSALRARAGAA